MKNSDPPVLSGFTRSLAVALGERDRSTRLHSERVVRLSLELGRDCELAGNELEILGIGAHLHDIGKIGIPDAVLLKQGRLEDAERAAMQRHVDLGGSIIDKILGDLGLRHLPDSTIMKNIVRHHHEMLDGSGYPEGLRGDAIALEARIVTVADIFDALMSPRPYKPAWTFDASCAELARLAALGKLDPECVAALRQNEDAVRAILARYQDRADV